MLDLVNLLCVALALGAVLLLAFWGWKKTWFDAFGGKVSISLTVLCS